MTYRELRQKKIVLACKANDNKLLNDIKDFFCELHIADELNLEDNGKLAGKLSNRKDTELLILLADAKAAESIPSLSLYERGKDFLLLDDLFAMIDELETFYLDKQRNDKAIIAYGSDTALSKLKALNPNIRINAEISHTNEDANMMEIKSALAEYDTSFWIICDAVSKAAKEMFEGLGLNFGKEFHFFNTRVPKHLTSYYLEKTMFDKPQFTIPCDYTTRALSIKKKGMVMGCCSSISLAFGDILHTSLEEVLDSIPAQIIWLSIKNRTYSFCGNACFMYRENKYRLSNEKSIKDNKRKEGEKPGFGRFNVQLCYDRSCNLACPSCRTHRIVAPEDDEEKIRMIHQEVRRMALAGPQNIRVGNGEVFFSRYYKDILFNCYQSRSIALISNGMLFNEENWKKLKQNYEHISLEFSIDATTPEIYKHLRGGDYSILQKNMAFASRLRREGQFDKFTIGFVIQNENFRQMPDFVEYGLRLGVDRIHFMKINQWGHIPDEEFAKIDVYSTSNENHEEFVSILRNPLLHMDIVHVDNIENFV